MKFLEFIDNLEYRIKIKYPSDWEKKVAEMGTIVIFVSPLEHKYDKFRENFSILVKDIISNSFKFDKTIEFEIKQLNEALLNFKLLNIKRFKISRKKAYRIIYKGKQREFDVKLMQVYILKNNKLFLLTYTAEIENYEIYTKIVKKMIKSFSFI